MRPALGGARARVLVQRLVVGITGSSAPHYGVEMLRCLTELDDVESHVVISKGARTSLRLEMDLDWRELEAMADVAHDPVNLGAAISSGSFQTLGMAIVPCSMKTLASVASGVSQDLVARAADVCLKERRKLVLLTRETPLNLIHIRNMETVTLAGGVILPPMPAFYHRPATIEDLIRQTVGKVLDQFGITHSLFRRWEPTPVPASAPHQAAGIAADTNGGR